MITENLIYKSTSLREVKNLLQTSSNTLSELCQDSTIAKWAKYKPTPYMYKNDEIINDGKDWAGLNGEKWWMGGIVPVYTIPVMSKLEDIKNDNGWIYNKPQGTEYEPFRLSDFIGYQHIEGYSPFITALPESLLVNNFFSCGIYYYEAEGVINAYSADDIAGLVNRDEMYVGITIINKTRGTSSSGVSQDKIESGYDNTFYLEVNEGKPISQGGMGLQVNPYDEIDVYLYLTPDRDANWQGLGTKYSALLDSNSVTYRSYTAGIKQTYTDVNYTVKGFKALHSSGNTQYIRYDDCIYKSERSIDNFLGLFSAESKGNSDYSNLNINISSQCKITVNDETYTVDGVMRLPIYSSVNGNFERGLSIKFDEMFEMPEYTYYRTYEDAENEVNGYVAVGIPIFNEVLYNGGDAEAVGKIMPTSITLSGNMSSISSNPYHQTRLVCKDESNVTQIDNSIFYKNR